MLFDTPAPVVHMLADPVTREKLRAICRELDIKKFGMHVWLGCGDRPVRMSKVSELLTVFPLGLSVDKGKSD